MKKIIVPIVATLLCAAVAGQPQLESFYGLKLGGKYSERAVLNALLASRSEGDNTKIIKDTLPSFGRLTYSIGGIAIKTQDSSQAIKATATVIMSPENVFEAVVFTPDSKDIRAVSFVADAALPDIRHFLNANVIAVESEFFGQKLGSDVNLTSLVRAVGDNGSYLSSRTEGKVRVHTFKDVSFAGESWEYALFSVTPAGKLVGFTVYKVFEGSVKGYHPANRLHIRMRDLYLKKYGYSVPYAEEEEILNEYVFSGQNGLDQIVSFFDIQTDRGKDAYCVQMEFVHDALNRAL